MPTAASDPWGALTIALLPLFNGEALRTPIEELNQLVGRHIAAVVSSSPSKTVVTLESSTMELLTSGMVTLNTKLNGVDDDKLVNRVVDRWSFFWDQVLTYVEGVLLPLQNDPLISSLYRTPKRPSSPRRQATKGSISSLNSAVAISSHHIDVRTLALRSFRDRIILPLFQRLYGRLSAMIKQEDGPELPARLRQMLLVLHAQARQRPQPFSLTAPPPQPSQGEAAVNDLLRLIQSSRSLRSQNNRGASSLKSREVIPSRAPSFLSGGVPRDRRGRIAMKSKSKTPSYLIAAPNDTNQADISGDETPRNATGNVLDLESKERERFLESLRSPDVDTTTARESVGGGWGLGAGDVDNSKAEEEEELLNWEQAQQVVEEMIGMEQAQTSSRRRMT
ncbi:hypothetical protein VNI00_012048 [Paramarasmius palmivorus]|uniref:HbrB-domain-containing protein n=1 Tax=Paramarasmius palmivorus TaxID=297713 RepID=A0AAW0C8B3_9AGAR